MGSGFLKKTDILWVNLRIRGEVSNTMRAGFQLLRLTNQPDMPPWTRIPLFRSRIESIKEPLNKSWIRCLRWAKSNPLASLIPASLLTIFAIALLTRAIYPEKLNLMNHSWASSRLVQSFHNAGRDAPRCGFSCKSP